MAKHIFVGGPFNGKKIWVGDDSEYVDVPIPSEGSDNYSIHRYSRHTYNSMDPDVSLVFFVSESLRDKSGRIDMKLLDLNAFGRHLRKIFRTCNVPV